MFRTLGAQLGAVFLGFLLLVVSSAGATFAAVHTQANDATIINLAGRQRMLTQRMTWLALAQADSPDLAASIQRFDETLHALQDGGPALDTTGRPIILPAAPNPALQTQLDEVAQTWTAFQEYVQVGDNSALQTESSHILAQLDAVVSAFEAEAQLKILRLQQIQTAFLVAALLLLAWGYFVTRRRIIRPLATLDTAARRIGKGLLSEPVPALGDDELGRLAHSFETMRAEIAAAHDTLESRVAQRTRELATAFEFSQEIVRQFDLDHLLNSVTDHTRSLMHARAAALCLLTPEGEYLELVSSSGETVDHIGIQQSTQRGLPLQVVGSNQAINAEVRCSTCSFLCDYPSSFCAAAPLRVGEHTLGALCVVRGDSEPFDADETRALTLLANSAAIAITNARLAETSRLQAEQSAVLTERERLAADLHDNLAQTLGFLNLKTERVEETLAAGRVADAVGELGQMKPTISMAYQQVRTALTGLREPPPTNGDLSDKLAACVAEFSYETDLLISLTIADDSALLLPHVTQAQVLHIVREALTNTHRHAQASQVQIRVSQVRGVARFVVTDDGCGFDPDSVEGDDHLGLEIMQARAQRSGGNLTINSTPGAGTKVIGYFPVRVSDSNNQGQMS
jgi:two-component system nitrate/nitrite sensor histidine kinase NarX